MPPDDFCNYLRRAGNQTNSALVFLAGTETSISFLFFTHHAAHRWAVARGEPRSVHFADPGAGSSGYPVCPAAMSSRVPHHRRVAPSMHSED